MNQIMVSIYVPTYNHENYIVRALDSILMQKTQYSYEVFVGEDCSSDHTRRLLEQWEEEHKDPRFKIFYRPQNMHQSAVTNASDLKSRCKGKYIICLEGDDFWTDPDKLQQQVSFLEAHPEYYAVAHNCMVVGEDSEPIDEEYPECKDTEYTFRHFASYVLPGQYTTFLSRNYMIDPHVDRQLLSVSGGAGDRRVYFSVLCHGKIYCIQKCMSAYRHITTSGTSFSATNRYDFKKLEADARNYLVYAYKIQHTQAIRCAELLYLLTIRHAWRKEVIQLKRAWMYLRNVRYPMRAVLLMLRRDLNCRVFYRTVHI